MNILHFASIDGNKASGVSVVVPEHVKNQSFLENVAIVNCSNVTIDFSEKDYKLITYSSSHCANGNIDTLPKPFNNPDLVVFHGIYFYYYIKVAKYLIEKKIPYVIVPHGSLTSYAQASKKIKKYFGNLLLFNRFIKSSTAIQYLTYEEQESSSRFRGRSFICGNGVYAKNESIKVKDYSERKIHLTFIGRLDPYHKGLDVLIEACNMISQNMRKNNIHLSIFGPDHQDGEKNIKKLVQKYELEDIVSVDKPLYGDEKYKRLMNTDVFILTSRFEGQPLSVLEALSFGIPVILTPGTNLADDVVRYNCGWRAEFSAESISDKIIETYDLKIKNSLFEYSLNAIKMVQNVYSWDKIAYRTIQEYKKIINHNLK